jgi:serine/threonine protein kinase
LEYADAGDLYDWTTQWYQSADATMTTQAKNNTPSSATIPEWMARDIFGQLAHALHYLHERDITHRDVKLENVLLARIPVTAAHPLGLRVILADFGLAISMTPSDMQQPLAAGSDEYAAPEVVLSAGSATVSMGSALSTGADGTPGYTRSKTDVWALGVVLYALLFGQLPFLRKPNQTRRSFLYRVARGDVQFPVREHMSAEALEVVRALLRRRPGERPSVSTVMSMAWMQGWEPLSLSQSTIRYPQQHHTLNRTPYATKTTLAAH